MDPESGHQGQQDDDNTCVGEVEGVLPIPVNPCNTHPSHRTRLPSAGKICKIDISHGTH